MFQHCAHERITIRLLSQLNVQAATRVFGDVEEITDGLQNGRREFNGGHVQVGLDFDRRTSTVKDIIFR